MLLAYVEDRARGYTCHFGPIRIMTASMTTYAATGVTNLESMAAARRYNAFLLDQLACLPSAGRVLDVGAGTGTFAAALVQQGYDVCCIEPDPVLAQRLQAKGLLVAASLEALPEKTAYGAYSFNVLEHVNDDVGLLKQLHAVLHRGSPLVLYVPAFPSLYSEMDRQVGHVRRYLKQDLKEKVEAAGFKLVALRYCDVLGYPAALVYKWLGGSGALTESAVARYDRWIFPVSRQLDRWTETFLGKNLLLIGTA